MKARLIVEANIGEIKGISPDQEAKMILDSPGDFLEGDDVTLHAIISDDNDRVISYRSSDSTECEENHIDNQEKEKELEKAYSELDLLFQTLNNRGYY